MTKGDAPAPGRVGTLWERRRLDAPAQTCGRDRLAGSGPPFDSAALGMQERTVLDLPRVQLLDPAAWCL